MSSSRAIRGDFLCLSERPTCCQAFICCVNKYFYSVDPSSKASDSLSSMVSGKNGSQSVGEWKFTEAVWVVLSPESLNK